MEDQECGKITEMLVQSKILTIVQNTGQPIATLRRKRREISWFATSLHRPTGL
jgi:hypothetical protein